ncbi:hypothetical protein BDW62DRAFT_80007 [Aspergillus aurantiobrunneus]
MFFFLMIPTKCTKFIVPFYSHRDSCRQLEFSNPTPLNLAFVYHNRVTLYPSRLIVSVPHVRKQVVWEVPSTLGPDMARSWEEGYACHDGIDRQLRLVFPDVGKKQGRAGRGTNHYCNPGLHVLGSQKAWKVVLLSTSLGWSLFCPKNARKHYPLRIDS